MSSDAGRTLAQDALEDDVARRSTPPIGPSYTRARRDMMKDLESPPPLPHLGEAAVVRQSEEVDHRGGFCRRRKSLKNGVDAIASIAVQLRKSASGR